MADREDALAKPSAAASHPPNGGLERLPRPGRLGHAAQRLGWLKTLIGFGPKIDASVSAKPEGLLLHDRVVYSFFPPNFGMRR